MVVRQIATLLFSFSFVEFKSRQHHGGCSFCRLAIWPFFTATKNCTALCGMLAGPALVWAAAEGKIATNFKHCFKNLLSATTTTEKQSKWTL